MKKKGAYVKAVVGDRKTSERGEGRGGVGCWAKGDLQEIGEAGVREPGNRKGGWRRP